MQQPHLPTAEQAEASLARFYENLGHRPLDTGFTGAPRMSAIPVHEDLARNVRRWREAEAAPRPLLKPATSLRVRLARRRVADAADRLFNWTCTAVVIGITGFVLVPAAVTIAGTLQ